jgi:hypothetical protein
MPNELLGLPLHPLIVHATVVMVPLAALTVVLSAAWPRFRSWAGPLPVGISAAALTLIPLSTSTGETLERHVERSALLEKHTQLADGLLPWTIALLVTSVVGYGIHWRHGRGHAARRAAVITVAVLSVLAASGTGVQIARIGHSGARAAWADTDMSSSRQS